MSGDVAVKDEDGYITISHTRYMIGTNNG